MAAKVAVGYSYPQVSRRRLRALRSRVTSWSSPLRRKLPWHYCNDPYKVLVAEVLVRKTRASDVHSVFDAIISRYPTVAAMAIAPPDELRRLIRPLGLPNRAETLQEAARKALDDHGGELPTDPTILMRWKGIGRYTANAVACLSLDRPYPMVDEAVGRLMRRVLGVAKDGPATSDHALWEWMDGLVPSHGAREFNLALLHLSSQICKPRGPRCGVCPLVGECAFAKAASGSEARST